MLAHFHASDRRRRCRSSRAQPALESLEPRALLATFMPQASATDGNANSLRSAIMRANANSQDNTIILQAGVYQLTVPDLLGQENAGARGDLDLTDFGHTITIEGAGPTATVIDGGKLDRVFQVSTGAVAVFRNLTIQNGLAQDDGVDGAIAGATPAEGGGIFNSGTAELSGVIVQDCVVSGGAGQQDATSQLAALGMDAIGGGIQNFGTLVLDACTVRDNSAIGGTGGNDNSIGQTGGGGYGGGISSVGIVTIRQSAIVNNSAFGGTGGTGGHFAFQGGLAGGLGGFGSGGGFQAGLGGSIETTIIDSTIAANRAAGGMGGTGGTGAVAGTVGLDGGPGGNGSDGSGGGIASDSILTLENSTIAANLVAAGNFGAGGAGGAGKNGSGNPGGNGNTGHAIAGGIWAQPQPGQPAFVTSISTIVAENIGADKGPDVYGSFANASNSLLGDGAGSIGLVNGVSGNRVGVDPLLGPLQDNGGPTPTMALEAGSPAIDAGSNPLGLGADQRGYITRSQGAAPDMGAFESGAVAPPGASQPTLIPIMVKVVKIRGRRQIRVYNAGTAALKFEFYPFGKRYRGNFQFQTSDVNDDGVADVIAVRHLTRKKTVTRVFSGVDGKPLPAGLV